MTLAAKLDDWLDREREKGGSVVIMSVAAGWLVEVRHRGDRLFVGRAEKLTHAKLECRLAWDRYRSDKAEKRA